MGDNDVTREYYHRRTIEIDDLDMYCLFHSTLMSLFSFDVYMYYFAFTKFFFYRRRARWRFFLTIHEFVSFLFFFYQSGKQ